VVPTESLVRLETREFWSAPAEVPWLPRLPRPTGADQSLACVGVSRQYYNIPSGDTIRLLVTSRDRGGCRRRPIRGGAGDHGRAG
jgi:hypothetical protein